MRQLVVFAMLVSLITAEVLRAAADNGISAPPGSETEILVRLSPIPLVAPEATVSCSEGSGVALLQGVAIPAHSAKFAAGSAEASIEVAGGRLAFLRNGSQLAIGSEAGILPLQPLFGTMGYRPVLARVAGRAYPLAFPYGSAAYQGGLVYYRSNLLLRGILGAQTVLVYDDNLDGQFTMSGDALRVVNGGGPACVLAPISKYIGTASAVYEIKSLAENGSELRCGRYGGKTARAALMFASGEAELHAAFGCKDADLNFVAVATPRSGSELTVIPGVYNLLYGLVYAPRLRKVVAALRPGKMQEIEIKADERVRFAMGAPTLEFEYRVDRGQLMINPASFRVRGSAGEEYAGVTYTAVDIAIVSGGRMFPVGSMGFR